MSTSEKSLHYMVHGVEHSIALTTDPEDWVDVAKVVSIQVGDDELYAGCGYVGDLRIETHPMAIHCDDTDRKFLSVVMQHLGMVGPATLTISGASLVTTFTKTMPIPRGARTLLDGHELNVRITAVLVAENNTPNSLTRKLSCNGSEVVPIVKSTAVEKITIRRDGEFDADSGGFNHIHTVYAYRMTFVADYILSPGSQIVKFDFKHPHMIKDFDRTMAYSYTTSVLS